MMRKGPEVQKIRGMSQYKDVVLLFNMEKMVFILRPGPGSHLKIKMVYF